MNFWVKRFQRLSTEALRIELATAEHDREVAKLAAIVGKQNTAPLVLNTTNKIAALRRLLGETEIAA